MKKLFIAILAIGVIILFFLLSYISAARRISKWGNYANFTSDIQFDSITMKVCEKSTTFYIYENDSTNLYTSGSGFRTPEKGFPCPVEFEIFLNGNKIRTIKAPHFNCNHCDVNSHNYNYSKGEITYSVSH